MNVIELLLGIKGGPINQILKIVTEIRTEQQRIAQQDQKRFDAIDKKLGEMSDQLDVMKGQLDKIEAAVITAPRLADFGWSESKPRKR